MIYGLGNKDTVNNPRDIALSLELDLDFLLVLMILRTLKGRDNGSRIVVFLFNLCNNVLELVDLVLDNKGGS